MLGLEAVELVAEALVEHDAGGGLLVGAEDLLAEHVDELVEAQVHLGLALVVQVALAEDGERVHRRVVVQVERIEDELHERLVATLQYVAGEYPRHGHLDGKLDLLAHGHLQIELAVPHLRQVAAALQRVGEVEQIGPVEGGGVKGLDGLQVLGVDVLAEGLLAALAAAAAVADERLEHGAHHVELRARRADEARRRPVDLVAGVEVFFAAQRRVVVGLLALVPVDAGVAHREQYALGEVLLATRRLAYHVAQLELHKRLQVVVRVEVDGLLEGAVQPVHERLQALDHRDDLDESDLLRRRVVVLGGALVLLGVLGTRRIALVIGEMQQLPVVQLEHRVRPLGEQLQAVERQRVQALVLVLAPLGLFANRNLKRKTAATYIIYIYLR